jgi:uncharacterized protein (DUF169 family)
MESINNKINEIKRILNTDYDPVGVKILQETNNICVGSFEDVSSDKRFCYYVRLASKGRSFIVKEDEKLECKTPYFCLGFREPKYADFEPRIKPALTKTVLIAPLSKFTEPVDSIVFIVNSKQAMILVDGMRRVLNKKIQFTVGASMSICGEVVAGSIVTQSPSLSVLCFGARIFSEYEDFELAFGIPSKLFDPLHASLKKLEILQKLEIELKNEEVK